MGTYISNQDLYDVYGQNNIITWSDLSGGRTLDQDRVDSAIKWAESLVQNRFRKSKYSVPFTIGDSGVYDSQLTNWMATYAGDKLYKGRMTRRGKEEDNRTSALIKETVREIQQVLGGQLDLDAGTIRTPIPSGPIAIM